MKARFVDVPLKDSTLEVISQANTIINQYLSRGFTLTLRQLYYQFVSRDLLANKQTEYKRLGDIVDKGRKGGLIDWSAIEDRTRNLERLSTWSSPAAILRTAAEQYREDWWLTQDFYAEQWIEKDALTGVIEGICEEYRMPYFACRGYVSQSEMYDAAQRFKAKRKPVKLFYFGDLDPSGVHMSRDIEERLQLFSRGADIEVIRLGLNMEQVEAYSPPPNPAKESDSRFEAYREEYGEESWELDALDPDVIVALIRDALDERIDGEAWEAASADEENQREGLTAAADRWDDVKEWLENGGEQDE